MYGTDISMIHPCISLTLTNRLLPVVSLWVRISHTRVFFVVQCMVMGILYAVWMCGMMIRSLPLTIKKPPGSFSHSPMPWHSGCALTITGILAKLCMCCTCFAPVARHVRYALHDTVVSYVSSYARACPGVSGLGFE
ncbi:hypothetical protein ORF035L [Spotted knifejaw iridovirus]|nr:hypothetical protein ORF035L [Spotted knifejaw iridovirus]